MSSCVLDVFSLLNRQLDHINASSSSSNRPKDDLSTVISSANGVMVLADVHPTIAKLFLLEESTSSLLRAGGASAMSHPISQELLLISPQQDSVSGITKGLPTAPLLSSLPMNDGPSLLGSGGTTKAHQVPTAIPNNIPTLRSLLSQPEMTTLKTPWSAEFSHSLRRVGFPLDDPELPPVARVHLSTASAQLARDKVQEFIDASIKTTTTLVKKTQELMISSALTTPHGYWSREQRNLLLQLGFAPDVLRVPCSKKPHITSVLRVAAQAFINDFISRCTKPVDNRFTSQSQAELVGNLRMLSEEQIAEFEYADSLLYAPNSPLKLSVWPILTCEFLRLTQFHALAKQAPDVPFQELEGVSAALRQDASDFLRQRNHVCPMETVEETITRRCKEILSSSYLSTTSDVWPEDLRQFMRMLDFLPNEMNNSRSVIRRDVRDAARNFLEIRAQGGDPKVEMAKGLLNNPAFRLTHRPLMPEQILQIYLLGFPCRVFDDGIDALINFQPDSSLKSEMHRYLTEYVRCHDDRSARRIQRFKELLHSSYLCSDHAYWPKEIRTLFSDEGYFRQELSSPIHERLSIPSHIRSAARYFVEGWLRDRFASLLSSFPSAMVPSFPALSTLPDDNHQLGGNDDSAQSQWSMQDRAAHQKDTLREDTVGNDALLKLLPTAYDEEFATPSVKVENASNDPVQNVVKPTELQSNQNTVSGPPAYLHFSVFRVEGAIARVVDDFASVDPSVHHQARNQNKQPPSDLHSYLANSNFAQGQLDTHSIRPVVSIALLHNDSADSLVMASSAQALSLVDHTWSRLPPQELSAARGGLQSVQWTPLLMGSCVHTSACSVDTNIHTSVFQEVEPAAVPIVYATQQLDGLRNIQPDSVTAGVADHHGTEILAPRPYDSALPSTQYQSSRFGDPYSVAPGFPASNQTSTSFSPTPAPRPRPQPAAPMSTYNRPGGLPVRSRFAARPPLASTRPPPFSSARSLETIPSRPMIPTTPIRPANKPQSFSDVIDITPPPRRAGQHPPIFSPVADNVSDSDILRMVKNAEINAGITTNNFNPSSDLFGSSTTTTTNPWDRRRGAENISRARAQPQLHDEFAPVSIPASTLVDGVSLSNVAGRRPVASAMNFDMRSNEPVARGTAKPLSFDDMPVGGGGNQSNPVAPPPKPFGHNRWEDEVPRAKEEIEVDEGLRTPSFSSRRRMRDTLTMSPLSSVRVPAVARRRVEAAPGLEQYSKPPQSGFPSSARNSFDNDPIGVPSKPAHPWDAMDEQPAGVASRRQLAPVPSAFSAPQPASQPTGRPPLASTTSTSEPQKLTSSERVALARARREELQRLGAPTQNNTNGSQEVVVAVPKGPSPFASQPPSISRPTIQERSNPFQPSISSAVSRPTLSSSRGFGASLPVQGAARLAARNPFADSIDINVSQPPRRAPFSSSVPSTSRFGGISDDEALRQIREEQHRDEQRAKATEEAERKRRQEQLVQERLRRVPAMMGPTISVGAAQGPANSLPDGMSSIRTGTLFAPQVPLAVQEAKHRVLCEASFSVRSIVAALIAARVDLHVLHEHDAAVSAILQSESSERIRVFVVPPSPNHPHEVLPCAIVMIPLHTHNTSNVETTFSLCLRVHNAHDFIAVVQRKPLITLPLLQSLDQSSKKSYSDGSKLLGWKNRFALLKLSLSGTQSPSSSDTLRVLDQLCDPFVTEARAQNLAVRFQLFNHRRSKARERISRQSDHQHQLRSLGLRDSKQPHSGINLFVSPLETLNDDAHMWPLLPVVRSRQRLEDEDAAPTGITGFHIHHILTRQRIWLESRNPLVALRSRKSLKLGQQSNTTVNTTFFIEIEKLLRTLSVRHTSVTNTSSAFQRLAQTSQLYVGRGLLFVAWILIQQNSTYLFPVLCLLVALLVSYVHLKSLWGFGLQHRVVAASASSIAKEHLKLGLDHGGQATDVEQRAALLAAVGFMAQKLRRFLRGDSIASSAMWMAVCVPSALAIWWLWFAFTTTGDASLTDKDRYLGLNRHVEVDYATGTVTTVVDANSDAFIGLATLELHFYTGYLILAPYTINPMKWVLWSMFQFFMQDPALLALHT
ncbi:transmembrane protein, putative [Bodo saltans]|uniref:Transmembrane protein, putative n=1 Tax=Bodo saltans TaxID=75058 RepID=A0A0S4JLC3_BODSA|nr:transmembrane protein, putative [Bodo saltans]|eukprot:CUG90719.1 transmembrane protein, putative [Bodo saltans]